MRRRNDEEVPTKVWVDSNPKIVPDNETIEQRTIRWQQVTDAAHEFYRDRFGPAFRARVATLIAEKEARIRHMNSLSSADLQKFLQADSQENSLQAVL